MDIKAIFFDLGNVLLSVHGKRALGELERRCGLSWQESAVCFARANFQQYELGLLTTQSFFDELKKVTGFDGTSAELRDICSDIFVPIDPNITLARSLMERYRLGIISNTNQAHVDFLQGRFDFFDMFAARIYSCEVHSRKPDAEIFAMAAKSLHVGPEQSLFIDDLAENVNAAAGLGWHAVQFCGNDLKEALRPYGVVIDSA
jgi:FMN phosphatase YigB (HAD superfamily)